MMDVDETNGEGMLSPNRTEERSQTRFLFFPSFFFLFYLLSF